MLPLVADECGQLSLERILFGTVAFAGLLSHSAFALMDQDFELFFAWPQWPSGQRFSFSTKAGNDLGIDSIVLGATSHRKSEVLHLSGVEHTEGQAPLVERGNEPLAINPSGFQPKMDLGKLPTTAPQLG